MALQLALSLLSARSLLHMAEGAGACLCDSIAGSLDSASAA